jgi:hypothetical protein
MERHRAGRTLIRADIAERESAIYGTVTSGELSIDDSGRIWKLNASGPVRAENHGRGYLQIRRRVNGRLLWAMAHRIVYRHFNGPIPDGLTINHKDGVKTNNAPSNLETATPKEQIWHAIRELGSHKRVRGGQNGEAHLMAKLREPDVLAIRRARAEKQPIKELAARYGVSQQTISKTARGDRWAHIPIEGDR